VRCEDLLLLGLELLLGAESDYMAELEKLAQLKAQGIKALSPRGTCYRGSRRSDNRTIRQSTGPISSMLLLSSCAERLLLERVELGLGDRARVEQALRLVDLGRGAAAARGLPHVLVELGLLAPRSLEVALRHAVVLREEIDKHSEEGQDDHEDEPERLRS